MSKEEIKEIKKPVESKKPETKKQKVKKADVEKAQEDSFVPQTIVEDAGINLIPIMSREEVVTETKKKKRNVLSLVSLSALFSVSILIIGFNIVSKIQLNAEKAKLLENETRMSGYSQQINDNNEILRRIALYEDIQKGRFSTKDVLEYIQDIIRKSGSNQLTEFSFSTGNSFAFEGEAEDLEDVSKLWYLLTNDNRMEEITLKSVSKGDGSARFSFTGKLNLDTFEDIIEG